MIIMLEKRTAEVMEAFDWLDDSHETNSSSGTPPTLQTPSGCGSRAAGEASRRAWRSAGCAPPLAASSGATSTSSSTNTTARATVTETERQRETEREEEDDEEEEQGRQRQR
jgi:hypothetical protein